MVPRGAAQRDAQGSGAARHPSWRQSPVATGGHVEDSVAPVGEARHPPRMARGGLIQEGEPGSGEGEAESGPDERRRCVRTR